MRTSKLIAPVREAVQQFFAEELGLGYLITKMLSITAAVALLMALGFMMRYGDGSWPIILWIAVFMTALIRFVFRYWWPVIWQKLSNAWKSLVNKLRENDFLELDVADKFPFLCTNCRHPKLYYDKIQPIGRMRTDKPICNKCGTTDAVKVLVMWQQNPGVDTGSDEYLPPGAKEAFQERGPDKQY